MLSILFSVFGVLLCLLLVIWLISLLPEPTPGSIPGASILKRLLTIVCVLVALIVIVWLFFGGVGLFPRLR